MNRSNYKTWMCKHYLNGYCKYSSEECNFAHGRKDLQERCDFEFLEKLGQDDGKSINKGRDKTPCVRAPGSANG